MMDETSRPVIDKPADELAQQQDKGRDDSTDQQTKKGADEATSTTSSEG